MIRGMYVSASGMSAQQTALEVTANNLANANTTAYKRDGVVFGSMLEQAVAARNARDSVPGRYGGGSELRYTYTDYSAGPLQRTGSPIDAAILGEGFFAVRTPQNIVRYTRDGSFSVDPTTGILSTKDGASVLNTNDQPIKVGSARVAVRTDGTVALNDVVADRLKVVGGTAMRKTGANQFEGAAAALPSYQLAVGSLEGPNLSVVHSMVSMIEIMRTFESNQRALAAQDESLSKTINEVAKM